MTRLFLRAALVSSALALVPATTAALAAVDVNTYHELDAFMSVFERVRADYVDKVDDKKLIKGAIDGMLASLDPHSSYLDARDFDQMRTQTDGNYGRTGPDGHDGGWRREGGDTDRGTRRPSRRGSRQAISSRT